MGKSFLIFIYRELLKNGNVYLLALTRAAVFGVLGLHASLEFGVSEKRAERETDSIILSASLDKKI